MKEETKELSYRIYVTDALKTMTENTAKFAGGSYFKVRFYDQIYSKKADKSKPEKNGNEIANSLIGALTKRQ